MRDRQEIELIADSSDSRDSGIALKLLKAEGSDVGEGPAAADEGIDKLCDAWVFAIRASTLALSTKKRASAFSC